MSTVCNWLKTRNEYMYDLSSMTPRGAMSVPLVLVVYATVLQLAQSSGAAATGGPCDIYAAGGTPCVAAHSMTRALFAHYTGPLCALQAATDHLEHSCDRQLRSLSNIALRLRHCEEGWRYQGHPSQAARWHRGCRHTRGLLRNFRCVQRSA